MRIACFQGPERPDSIEGNLVLLALLAGRAQPSGAKLLVVPELCLTGYAIGAEAVNRLAQPPDGETIVGIRTLARDHGLALVLGFPERDGDRNYNTALAIGPDGAVCGCYHKTHLFGEVDRLQFSPGKAESDLFDLEVFRVGLLICHDVEFPENVRAPALRGADLVVVPTALMQPFDVVARTDVPARAYENQVYLAYVDRCGREAEFDHCGLSCVVGPDGVDLARAGRGEEMIFADIDRDVLEDSHRINTHLRDRRPALYQKLTEGTKA